MFGVRVDAYICNSLIFDLMQFLLESVIVVISSALDPFGLHLFIATVKDGQYV